MLLLRAKVQTDKLTAIGEADIDVMDEEQAPSMAAFADGVFNGVGGGMYQVK